ncbi:hypothetical protein CDAR_179741 [Caerostris darwini]|uniref:Uncharacterized protein n=1 Tax=Caerostris darwini TaxID=1538125 RepID=A0AAV4RK39_9ARAC|nr:hypothetical protein CDAR_179741 [Caerostris darwini]
MGTSIRGLTGATIYYKGQLQRDVHTLYFSKFCSDTFHTIDLTCPNEAWINELFDGGFGDDRTSYGLVGKSINRSINIAAVEEVNIDSISFTYLGQLEVMELRDSLASLGIF